MKKHWVTLLLFCGLGVGSFAYGQGMPKGKPTLKSLGVSDYRLILQGPPTLGPMLPTEVNQGTKVNITLCVNLVPFFFPGAPARPDFLTEGFMVKVKNDSPLYKAGIRTGDILTFIEEKWAARIECDKLDKILEGGLKGNGFAVLQFRHFEPDFWTTTVLLGEDPLARMSREQSENRRRSQPWLIDKEVIIINWK